jgi:hypothetical protein
MKQNEIVSSSKCFKALSSGLGLAAFYALFVVASPWFSISLPIIVMATFWAVIKIVMGYGIICFYQKTKEPKIAFAGILLLVSAGLSIFPISDLLAIAVEALAITSLSLVLYDLGKLFPSLKLSVPAGIIFLGVIFSTLNNEMMISLAGFAWLFGFLFASSRVNVLSRLRFAK